MPETYVESKIFEKIEIRGINSLSAKTCRQLRKFAKPL